MAQNIFLVSGDDPSLLSQKVRALVAECVGEQSPETVLTRFEEADYEMGDIMSISPLVAAANTDSMFGAFRVIEAHHLGHFTTQEALAPLLEYLQAPLDTTSLVLVWEKGIKQTRSSPLPKKLKEAVKTAGGQYITASKPRGQKDTRDWFTEQVQSSELNLDGASQKLIQEHLGEDVGRLKSVLEVLNSALGSKKSIGAQDILPFLGQKGSVPVWELTAALAKGEGEKSLRCLKRQLNSGEHPIGILYFLVNHYIRIAQLDGAGFESADQVAKELGMARYPAQLALEEVQKLGTHKIKRIIELLANADEDMKGRSGLDPELILEILVARVAQQYRLNSSVAKAN